MLRWFIVILLSLVLISGLTPLLQKMGLGRLPGDLRFRALGRDWYLPIGTTALLSFIAALVSHLI